MVICCQCGQKIENHKTWTEAGIAESRSATFESPKTADGVKVYAPLHQSNVGRWIDHKPLPWEPSAEWIARAGL